MDWKYRWLLSIGAALLVLAGGLAFSGISARAQYGRAATPWSSWGPGGSSGAWGPGGMMRGFGSGPGEVVPWMRDMHNRMWGGNTGGELVPSAPAESGARRVEAQVAIREWQMDPAELKVTTGTRLVLTVRNDGDSPHDFAIPGLNLRLVGIAPGTTRTVELNADRAGSYPFLCDIPGHAQLGQRGVLTVTAPN